MTIWSRFLAVFSFFIAGFIFFGQPQAQALDLNFVTYNNFNVIAVEGGRRNVGDDKLATEYGKKVDLNNSAIPEFRQFRGFYPNLASKIIKNAPYEKVEDVLNIPDLSEKQKERLQANLDSFTVTPPAAIFLEGDERYNPGTY